MTVPALAMVFLLSNHDRHEAPRCISLSDGSLKTARVLNRPCYVIEDFTTVHAPIRIAAGTTVYFGQGSELVIGDGGSLDTEGTAQSPVVLRGREHAAGYWRGVTFNSRSPENRLSYTIVEDAGSTGSSDSAAVDVSVGSMLAMDHTTIRNAVGNGLYVDQRANLAAFSSNHFEQDDLPINVKASDLNMLDSATTFANNRHNVVYIHFDDSNVTSDETWHALAVPYEFHGTPSIHAHVTIEPGAELRFNQGSGLWVGDNGSLTAEGTAAKPIVFTGTEKAPGFWDGIGFNTRSPENILRHCIVTYAGEQDGATHGDIGLNPQSMATVQNCELGYSQTAAISVGQNAQLNTDAETSNHFHNDGAGIVTSQ